MVVVSPLSLGAGGGNGDGQLTSGLGRPTCTYWVFKYIFHVFPLQELMTRFWIVKVIGLWVIFAFSHFTLRKNTQIRKSQTSLVSLLNTVSCMYLFMVPFMSAQHLPSAFRESPPQPTFILWCWPTLPVLGASAVLGHGAGQLTHGGAVHPLGLGMFGDEHVTSFLLSAEAGPIPRCSPPIIPESSAWGLFLQYSHQAC